MDSNAPKKTDDYGTFFYKLRNGSLPLEYDTSKQLKQILQIVSENNRDLSCGLVSAIASEYISHKFFEDRSLLWFLILLFVFFLILRLLFWILDLIKKSIIKEIKKNKTSEIDDEEIQDLFFRKIIVQVTYIFSVVKRIQELSSDKVIIDCSEILEDSVETVAAKDAAEEDAAEENTAKEATTEVGTTQEETIEDNSGVNEGKNFESKKDLIDIYAMQGVYGIRKTSSQLLSILDDVSEKKSDNYIFTIGWNNIETVISMLSEYLEYLSNSVPNSGIMEADVIKINKLKLIINDYKEKNGLDKNRNIE